MTVMSLSRRRWLAALAGVAFLSVIAITVVAGGDTDQAAIRATVANGLKAQQSAGAQPDAELGAESSVGTVRSLKGQVHAELAKYFTGKQLGDFESALTASVDESAKGDLVYRDGGVDNLDFKTVVVDGDTATVTATGTVWARMEATPDNAGGSPIIAEPRGDEIFTFELVKRGDRWLISKEDFEFVPGQTP